MKSLLSVGLDVGTTSTQLVFSKLQVENRASAFSVPRMEITGREILYKSPVFFTPLSGVDRIDGEALRGMIEAEYRNADIIPAQVDTGAVIITGETCRRENAETVSRELSHLAGDFVVATAGPDLESVLAARGAGAVAFSEKTGKTLLHFDIGGGTSNLALIEQGKITATACLNVGGRLLKLDSAGTVLYVSPVLHDLTAIRVGDRPAIGELQKLCRMLVSALEAAAGLRSTGPVPKSLITNRLIPEIPKGAVMSFSGGVADCIRKPIEPFAFGDIGPLLGQEIAASALCRGEYRLGEETIRATVMGAGCHATQLSGSTVFTRGIHFPLQNLPVLMLEDGISTDRISRELSAFEECPVLGIKGISGYGALKQFADALLSLQLPKIMVASEGDCGKALGQLMATMLPGETPILCLDGLALREGDYLDVGKSTGLAYPVVIKTLIFS